MGSAPDGFEWHDFDCGVAGGFPHSSEMCGRVSIDAAEAAARRLFHRMQMDVLAREGTDG